jgi:hypothetical protein
MDIHLDIFGYHRIYSGYLLWICNGYLKWIFHLDKHGYPRICLGYVSKDISHGYVAWISLDMSGYLLDISSRYLFLDTSERYPILPKDIQEISFHILSYPTISRHIQPYPEISKWGELPDAAPTTTFLTWKMKSMMLKTSEMRQLIGWTMRKIGLLKNIRP